MYWATQLPALYWEKDGRGLRMSATVHMQWFSPHCCEPRVDLNHQTPGLQVNMMDIVDKPGTEKAKQAAK